MVKYYAVLYGREGKIFTTLDEAYPYIYKGASFKEFTNRHLAERWIEPVSPVTPEHRPVYIGFSQRLCYVYNFVNETHTGTAAAVVIEKDGTLRKQALKIPYQPCSSQQAELIAGYMGLQMLEEDGIMYTSSQYFMDILTIWIESWIQESEKNPHFRPPLNWDLIKMIYQIYREKNIIIKLMSYDDSNIFYNQARSLAIEAYHFPDNKIHIIADG